MSENPFVVGARVAVERNASYSNTCDYVEAFVEKVHKNGNFVLRGSPQQYRPYESNDRRWTAFSTGSGYAKRSVIIWNDFTDAEITRGISFHSNLNRIVSIRRRLEQMNPRTITAEMLDQIEDAINKHGAIAKAEGRS